MDGIDLKEEFGIDRHELARRTGLSGDTITKVMRGQNKCLKTRHKIEDALNDAIWSTESEFCARQELKKVLGGDPGVIGVKQLAKLARAYGVSYDPKRHNRQALIEDILKA